MILIRKIIRMTAHAQFMSSDTPRLLPWIQALDGYSNHRRRSQDEMFSQNGAMLIQEKLNQRGLHTSPLKISKNHQFFGFKTKIPLPTTSIQIQKAHIDLLASPHISKIDPKKDPDLKAWNAPFDMTKAKREEKRRALYILIAYQLPTRKDTANFYRDALFKQELRSLMDHTNQLGFGQSCLFMLNQACHVGVLVHSAPRLTLLDQPVQAVNQTLDQFQKLYNALVDPNIIA